MKPLTSAESIMHWQDLVEISVKRQYRAWSKATKEMFYDVEMTEADSVTDEDWVFMPSIGYHDKDMADIYVGDILQFFSGDAEKWDIGIVLLQEEKYVVKNMRSTYSDFSDLDSIEVMGDIYETPEELSRAMFLY